MENQQRWDSYGARILADAQAQPEKYRITQWPMPAGSEGLERQIQTMGLQGQRVLEVGCGAGKLAVWMAQRGAHVTATDIGPELVEAAQLVAALNGVALATAVADVRALPFAPGSFDLVVGRAVLHHLSPAEADKAAAAVAGVLRPGGALVVYEPIEDSALFDLMQNVVPRYRAGHPFYRPSILQRKAWAEYAAQRDDRAMTSSELRGLQQSFRTGSYLHTGLTVRLHSLWRRKGLEQALLRLDDRLLARVPFLRRYARNITATYWT